jgi:acetyltransferase-like isoleucine patch superfamily enzyme
MESFKKVGKNLNLNVTNLIIGKNVSIGDNVSINCDTFEIGDNSILGSNITISCKSFKSDEWLFMWDGVEVGRGGSYSPNSEVTIGKHVGIFENTIINPSDKVTIGDNVGIGSEVMIWTHGAWLDVMQGFPSDFGPVSIGKNVWLPARSIVLPNVKIGDNTVIGIGSIINKNIPAGSLAAGTPCKVLKENVYPKQLSFEEKNNILTNIVGDYTTLLKYKKLDAKVYLKDGNIVLDRLKGITIFNPMAKIINGVEDNISEDLRDYLRRRGIKIFTSNPFKSI